MATRGNRLDNKPFWTYYGKHNVSETYTCPIHKLISHQIEIKNLFGTIVGYLKWNSRGLGSMSRYIAIDKHKNRKWFIGKDVYCNECERWHFK